MKRIYHPYWNWEDWKAGMWEPVSGVKKKEKLQQAIEFTGDHLRYGKFMIQAVESWPIACEHNLTEVSMNRLAWIGHAATFIAIQSPESITREAWGHLSRIQQDLANHQARIALQHWTRIYGKTDSFLGEIVGAQGI